MSHKKNVDLHSFTPKMIIKNPIIYQKYANTYILNETINYINKSKIFEKKTDDDQVIWKPDIVFHFSFFLFPWVGVVAGEMAHWATCSYE